MASFFQELWESIFTPGPTPSLLIATNATFAVLQVVLFVLLIATYSIHFVILSVLAGGLWWAVNWFANELKVAKALQDEQDEEGKKKQRRRAAVAAATASPVSTDSETEVEGPEAPSGLATGKSTGRATRSGSARQRTVAAAAAQTEAETDGGAPALAAPAVAGAAIAGAAATLGSQDSNSASTSSQRLSSRSGVSTEDEWEKVSENEQ
ncbi:Sm snRNP core protein Smd1 [Sporothrix stenoceras]|uniref:Sm snRNP core protein Smd1 n=1 Tax=Sporothrix stenoceras TaxID=5173 RepID=A0ABR3ZNV4_9PEZI